MTKFDMFSRARTSSVRTRRNAVVAAGLGASMMLGTAGVAFAAEGTAASAVEKQAQVQAKAADTAKKAADAKKAAEVKKVADAKKAAEVKKAAAKAKAKKASSWEKPVKHYSLSATYGKGGGMWASKHSGQDFAVPVGTPVDAVHGGTVVKAGPNGGGDGPAYGNAIVIKHANGTYSQYAHLSKIQVTPGETVKTGERIALSGNTGNSSGPHLHFEIRTTPNYGTAINPVSFLRAEGVSV
ncbi:peptidase [Streptomyces agglomeratus]|uniref:Peptidase n=1 Tax=Streptomyces agglomeratus TaxID=285458 RepID=A0A1E5P852_9ACTN|nr:M23 family metallopeptidase [Streptomyces agglomeratus]OEJ25710.1 peptidase [Streptomyces agglomeratus]OEJ52798.1 peptidase [Streptomyces agglomeratus]